LPKVSRDPAKRFLQCGSRRPAGYPAVVVVTSDFGSVVYLAEYVAWCLCGRRSLTATGLGSRPALGPAVMLATGLAAKSPTTIGLRVEHRDGLIDRPPVASVLSWNYHSGTRSERPGSMTTLVTSSGGTRSTVSVATLWMPGGLGGWEDCRTRRQVEVDGAHTRRIGPETGTKQVDLLVGTRRRCRNGLHSRRWYRRKCCVDRCL